MRITETGRQAAAAPATSMLAANHAHARHDWQRRPLPARRHVEAELGERPGHSPRGPRWRPDPRPMPGRWRSYVRTCRGFSRCLMSSPGRRSTASSLSRGPDAGVRMEANRRIKVTLLSLIQFAGPDPISLNGVQLSRSRERKRGIVNAIGWFRQVEPVAGNFSVPAPSSWLHSIFCAPEIDC